MKQQNSSKALGSKFLNYVNSLCLGVQYEASSLPRRPSSPCKSRRSSMKPKRMTFLLDRTLLKLSRKNLIVQQFAGQQALNAQVQDHLASRLSGLGLATFHGDFPEKTVRSVQLGVRVSREQRDQRPIEEFLGISLPKSKKGSCPQAMVFNTPANSLKTVGQTLAANFRKVKHFAFIIQAEIEAIDYHGLFLIYRDYFLFEVEKIMVINRCIANILYVSASADFLKLDNSALANFLTEQITAKDPVINRADFAALSLRLLNGGLHIETTTVVGELITTSLNGHYDEQFVIRMKKRYPKSVAVIDGFLKELRAVHEEEGIKQLPKFHENTPEFKNEEPLVQNLERQFENSGLSENDRKNMVHVSFGVGMPVFRRNLDSQKRL